MYDSKNICYPYIAYCMRDYARVGLHGIKPEPNIHARADFYPGGRPDYNSRPLPR
jgi:hypothetical protein